MLHLSARGRAEPKQAVSSTIPTLPVADGFRRVTQKRNWIDVARGACTSQTLVLPVVRSHRHYRVRICRMEGALDAQPRYVQLRHPREGDLQRQGAAAAAATKKQSDLAEAK